MFLTVGFLVSKDRGGGKLVLWDSVSLDRLAPIRGFCLSGACYSNLRAQMAQVVCPSTPRQSISSQSYCNKGYLCVPF